MGSLFTDLSIRKQIDTVRRNRREQAMRDIDNCPVLPKQHYLLEYLIFRDRIQCAVWLIENEDLRIPGIGPGNGQLLLFPAGKIYPLLIEFLRQHREYPVLQRPHLFP